MPPMTRPGARLTAIDAVRGLVMVVMALDHVREFFHADAMVFQAEDLTRTTPALFLTRWITHFCAPAFVFLAGVGAERRLQATGAAASLSRYLWTRGLWLVALELTVMRFALNFRMSGQDAVLVIILCALGLSMVALAALIHLPRPAIAGIGLAVVLLHNLLDPLTPRDFGVLAPSWNLLHDPGVFFVAGMPVMVGYPVLPWAGLMALGFAAGPIFDLEPARRRRLLTRLGIGLVVGFVLLRLVDGYGDPQPWAPQSSAVFTVLSFLRATKYPPSLVFLLMTIGPLLIALAWLDRRPLPPAHPLVAIGRVPLFYYVVHFFLAHAAAALLFGIVYGDFALTFLSGPFPSMGGSRDRFPEGFGVPLPATYLAWVVVVAVMYPLCRWYGRVKHERRPWWGRYL